MDARAAALSALAQFQVTETQEVAAAQVVGQSMISDDGKPTTAVYTDVLSPEIEGKGPSLDAWRDSTVLRVPQVEERADTHETSR